MIGSLYRWPQWLRTVRHLHASQVAWRVYRSMQRRGWFPRGERIPGPVPGWSPPPPDAGLTPPRIPGIDGRALLSGLRAGRLEQLHQERQLGRAPVDWRLGRRDVDRLWICHLHTHWWIFSGYQAALERETDEKRVRGSTLMESFLRDWLEQCGAPTRASRPLAWNAYTIATRLEWWARMFRLVQDDGNSLFHQPALRESAWRQAHYLERHLEWDLRANHLMRDAVGLAWAGTLFRGRHADRWLHRAADLATGQAREQILDDGGHFERSPWYHLEVMDDLATLASLLDKRPAREYLVRQWERMADVVPWIRHADGRVLAWNDGCRAPAGTTLQRGHGLGAGMPSAVPRGGRWLRDFGVVAWHGRPWTVFFDVGEVGADYQPGHAHADTLQVECAVNGRRLFVDPGSFHYDADDQRAEDRSTRAHNTVEVDGQNSTEVWHIFRVGRRARPRGVEVETRWDGFRARAAHTGYLHLPGAPIPSRTVTVDGRDCCITDTVNGRNEHCVRGSWLVEPGWRLQSQSKGWLLESAAARVSVRLTANQPLTLSVEPARVHLDYGQSVPARRLTWHYHGALPLTVQTRLRLVEDSRLHKE